jgi:RimJ/RimL family protein N-acetyltransferase
VTLRSARLAYRRLCPDDIDAFHGLCLDDHVRRFLLDGQEVPRQWATAAIETSERLFDSHGVGLWLLVRDRVPIGFCGFRAFDELGPEPQLLYALRRPYAGRGLATEAAAIMLEQTRRLGWTRVVGAVDQPNIASQRVLQNLGFGSAGRVPGAFGDTLLFERFEGLTPRRIDAAPGSRFRMGIASTWDGRDARPAETVEVELSLDDCELALSIDAPYHGDPPPRSAERLWEHEVVELFLAGDDDRYVEIELSPHGQHLVLLFEGERRVLHRGLALTFRASIAPDRRRWRGEALIPMLWIAPGTRRLNAYAMHDRDDARRHLAWKAPGGPRPDFHRLAAFGTFDDPTITRP